MFLRDFLSVFSVFKMYYCPSECFGAVVAERLFVVFLSDLCACVCVLSV